ncbi:MAG: hypothetical protein J0M29_06740 [Chitinophagales bacterium]|nr:hypothetical protein [Chitinophagales bacterium]
MKNFFEFFGFVSMACISAILIFIFIGGKKDVLSNGSRDGFLTEMGASSEIPDAPRAISDRPSKSGAGYAKRDKAVKPTEKAVSAEEQLKALYADQDYIAQTAKEWKGLVKDAADEYNLKPQVLLAHVLVQSYLGEYNRSNLYNDAARHAGERLKPVNTTVKGYQYGWTMQKLIQDFNLAKYFPEEVPVAAASIASPSRKAAEKHSTVAKGIAKSTAPVAKNNPIEEGFKSMVAKEYGFSSWAGMQKLADPDTKAQAAKRVKSLMMASRVR